MSGSRWADVCAAAKTVIDANTDSSVTVFNGPAMTGNVLATFVCIGARAPDEMETHAGRFDQNYRGLGAAAMRDEYGEIGCYIGAWSGDDDLAATHATAEAVLDDINDAFRDDPNLGLAGGPLVPEAEVIAGNIYRGYTEAGTRVELAFTIRYRTVI